MDENFLSEEGHRVKRYLLWESLLWICQPVVNGDLLYLPKLETTLMQARDGLNCSHFLWNGHQSMLFHQLSMGSQFGFRNKMVGWRGEGASTQGCFIDQAQDRRKPMNMRMNNGLDMEGTDLLKRWVEFESQWMETLVFCEESLSLK